ncbi:zinc finger protein 236 isoform X2 [Eurytemora carolleeae]|uniref:zinc finger protein 236 isoform X2 n=1 Tax=Eurytemora carolleeae TaxID=1294199 RepID=UPI000C78637A|nr:zinc finger protein 236 isoform X2 [Eurytemora carolleeae]|eukprot:XP_023341331.1 zinc finger protein 236-like isoform X2 [Eurytemora affinis]
MFFDEIEVTNKNDYIYIFSDLILFIMPETPEKLTDEATTLKEDVKDKGDDKKNEVEEKVSRDDMEEELDYEPAKDDPLQDDEVEMVEDESEDEGFEVEGDMTRLRCVQCEFLKFKNIDEWKNHCIGHWRLGGMKALKTRCFVKGCDFAAKDTNTGQRLSKLGDHFIEAHKFTQTAFRKCDICNLEFMEERKYNTHMKKHDPSFTCDLCKKKITGKFWYRKHIEKCYGDERPSWARKPVEVNPGEDKEVIEIYGKEYDVHWGTVTNTFTKKSRIVARVWIEGKAWAGKADSRDEARTKLIKSLKDHIKKTMDKGLYTLEDGELVPEPVLSETPAPATKPAKSKCPQCGTQFSKRANLELHMFMHRGDAKAI